MSTKKDLHLSSQFNEELNSVSTGVMEMGGIAEQQLQTILKIIKNLNIAKIDKVVELEKNINQYDKKLDNALATTIALRQPAARDLRLLLAISKMSSNLERIGNENSKIAEELRLILSSETPASIPLHKIKIMCDLVAQTLHKSLDAFARLNIYDALEILRDDKEINDEISSFTRELITYMMADGRTISSCLDLMTMARGFERISDHIKNIAELIIYVVKGENVRYLPYQEIIELVDIEQNFLDD